MLLYLTLVCQQGLELGRLLTSAFLHISEMHLFYNCSSLLWKVRSASLRRASGEM